MKTNIFVPEKINVGFVKRSDTYTGKLGYIIYFDEKGKLRKEASWNSWRDKDIDNVIEVNEPTSGFVLNKKAGGYDTGWNHRQTYVRVYDPRGFEFEIDIVNLLYILENTSSIKGKGLEGEFVYGWEGKNLVLIPTSSPDYEAIKELNKVIHSNNFVKAKDLKVGATYLTKDNTHMVYMGKFDEYGWDGEKHKTKSFVFQYAYQDYKGKDLSNFSFMKTLTKKIVGVVSEECVENYADLFESLERNRSFSPIDHESDERILYTEEELESRFVDWNGEKRDWCRVYTTYGETHINRNEDIYTFTYTNPEYEKLSYWQRHQSEIPYRIEVEVQGMQNLIDEAKPTYLRRYLMNGKLYSEDK